MNPKLIYFNRPPKYEAWGGGAHFITNLYEYLQLKGYRITFDLRDSPDLIFMFDPRPDGLNFAGIDQIAEYKSKAQCRVVTRVNDTDSARPKDAPWRDQAFIKCAKVSDHLIFISEWVKQYHENNGLKAEKSSIIYNGCNNKIFYKKNLSEPQRPIKLVTHHWSSNAMKGFDLYSELGKILPQQEYSFEFIGRWNSEYSSKNINLVEPLYGASLAEELRKHDIYITASKNEACGMHHIEAASCGLPVLYHLSGGGICEIAQRHGLGFNSVESCLASLEKIRNEYSSFYESINSEILGNEHCLKQYERVIISL